jgi:hypothetical protein
MQNQTILYDFINLIKPTLDSLLFLICIFLVLKSFINRLILFIYDIKHNQNIVIDMIATTIASLILCKGYGLCL